MSNIAVGPDNQVIALLTAPDRVKSWATVLDGTEARALAQTGVLRCGRSGCDAALFFRQGEERTPHFYHEKSSMGACDGLTGVTGEWHLKLQFEVFQHAFSQEWRMQGAIADVVIQRKNTANLFAVEVQHSPTDAETVLARHAAHKAAGLMGTVWIVDGSTLKKGLRIHKTWVIDLLKACAETPDGYPCTVLVYKDRRHVGGGETVSIIDTAEFGHEQEDGRQFAQVELVKKAGKVVRLPMEALSFLAEGPKRSQTVPASFKDFQGILDSIPTRRIKPPKPLNVFGNAA